MTAARLLRSAAGRTHDFARDIVWRHAFRIRRWRPITSCSGVPGKVLHVTTSFDLGGTQRQIQYLATSPAARFEHAVVEIFPELNYLFREGASVDAARYVQGGVVRRVVGRAIVSRNRRGWQLVQACKLARDFEVERPRVVVGWGHEIALTTFVAAALARVPRIVFCIRTVNPSYGWADSEFAALLRDAHRRTSPLVDRVIANSTFLRDDHAAWACIPPAQVMVCANGIAVEDIPPAAQAATRAHVRKRLGIPDDALVITNVGRFSSEKGQLGLVEAMRLLQQRTAIGVRWLLCGDGFTLPDVQAAAAAHGLANVIFTGRTNAVGGILSASDIFVMPSDYEGMPNAMMEAMAAGLPCVSTDRSGIRDIARNGSEALYYTAGDAEKLARHLQCLIEDPERRRALGEAAAARIREFTVERLVKCFEEILDGLPSVH